MLLSFSGKMGSGKDTAAEYLVKQYGFQRLAFADTLKEAALALNPVIHMRGEDFVRLHDIVRDFGWERAKSEYPEVRRLLQRLGTEVGRQLLGPNVWVDIVERKMLEYIAKGQTNFCISDQRFDNEVKFTKKYGGKSALIIRPGTTKVGTSHASEQLDFETDWLIRNDGTLDEFYLWVEHFYQMTRGGNV